jgi:DNA-binding beta-propeller fold protein YncE
VASYSDEAVAEFSRNTESGFVEQLASPNDCISSTAASECGTTAAIGLERAIGIAVSPDNKDVYVAAGGESGDGAIVALEREAATGALKQLPGKAGCISTFNKACAAGEAVNGPEDLVLSPDGKNIYANSYNSSAVIELDRNPETGVLTQLGCLASSLTSETEHCIQAKSIGGPLGVAISPGGQDLYVSSFAENAVAAFERDSESGALAPLAEPYECVTSNASGCGEGSTGLIGLGGARRLAVSPDGSNVYVAGQSAGTVVELDRSVLPFVSEVTPNYGLKEGGTKVTIAGGGFTTGSVVHFGAGLATNVAVNSSTSITATSPAGTETVGVTVTTPVGTSEDTFADSFSYVRPGFIPGGLDLAAYCSSLGYTGGDEGPAILTKGAVSGPRYAYENWACTSEASAVTTPITASGTAPSMENACFSQYGVPSYGFPTEEDNAFSWNCYEAKAPNVESIGPSSGSTSGGTPVTIKGTDFYPGATVEIGGKELGDAVVISETEITATTPAAGEGPVEVVVSDAGGTSTGGPKYTYLAGACTDSWANSVSGSWNTARGTLPPIGQPDRCRRRATTSASPLPGNTR